MKLLFHTSNYKYLADEIFKEVGPFDHAIINPIGITPGQLTTEKFPDGEVYHRIESDIADKDVYLIGGTISDAETMELYDIGCSILRPSRGKGANSLTIIIPYFGYSTMERAIKDGEVVKAKTRARLLSNIGHVRIFLVDLHADGIPFYFESDTQAIHLYGKDIIKNTCQEIKEKYKLSNFVLASTDAGRAKWIESLSKDMGVECAIIIKKRINGSETQIQGVNADVKNQTVIIYDDMIRTGGSLIKAARTYRDAGATQVFAIATHGILPTGSIEKIRESGYFEKIYVMDTHPNAVKLKISTIEGANSFLEVKSISKLLINNVFETNESR